MLRKQINREKLSHAYLLISRSKNSLAEEVNELINILKITPADFHSVKEEEGKLKIEQMRRLIPQIFLKPHSSKYKLFVIDGAGKLSREVANSLLKILEEPPSHSIIVLLAADERSILPTIYSRCQKIYLPGEDVSQPDFSQTSFLADIKQKTIREKFTFAEQIIKEENLEQILETWQTFFRQKLLEEEQTGSIIEKIQQAKKNLRQSVNPRLLIENLLLEIS